MPKHLKQTQHSDALQPVSHLFGVLAHPVRVKILSALHQQETDVSELQTKLGISQSSVSQHLQLLKSQGLVEDRRQGKHVFYHIKNPEIVKLLACAFNLMAIQLAGEAEFPALCEEWLPILGL